MTRTTAGSAPPVHRNLGAAPLPVGRRYVVTIGIDRYQARECPTLRNAVSDARGMAAALGRLGFESKAALLEERATRSALFRVVADLSTLSAHDSLVVFFAGHGHTQERPFSDGMSARIGYLVPADARSPAAFVRLDEWLRALAQLPPRHVLAILDCCGSGIALAPRYRMGGQAVLTTRSSGLDAAAVMEPLRTLRSRRVITSALDDQRAVDTGPIAGHSLFTGCLIEALSGNLFEHLGRGAVASSELFNHVRAQVWRHSDSQQTPDFGALEQDERGELIFEQPTTPAAPARLPLRPAVADRLRLGLSDFRTPWTRVPVNAAPAAPRRADVPPAVPALSRSVARPRARRGGVPRQPRRAHLDATFVAALACHDEERVRGRPVLSIISAESNIAAASWAEWAAQRGALALVTDATTIDVAVAEVLGAMPWLRLVTNARERLAAAVGVDAKLAALLRDPERLEDAVGEDLAAQIAAWLLSWSTAHRDSVLELERAPCEGTALLSGVCELKPPIAVLFRTIAPDEHWLGSALRVAGELARLVHRVPVAIAAPDALLRAVLLPHEGGHAPLWRNVVPLARAPHIEHSVRELADRAGAALASDARTGGWFERDVRVVVHDRDQPVAVELFARDALLAIVIDDGTADPQRQRDARMRDLRLQRAGYYLLRIPAAVIEHHVDDFVEEVARVLAGRGTSTSFPENAHAFDPR